jgi:hypothetical protein
MAKHDTVPIIVDCGLEGDAPRKQDHFFYPVMRPHWLEVSWQPPQNVSFAIIFTSKHAVTAFQQSIFTKTKQNKSWQNCISFGAVGATTAQSIQQQLAALVAHTNATILLPSHSNGLTPLLSLMQATLQPDVQFFIFTSAIGKSADTVTAYCKHHNRNIAVEPVYTLENILESNATPFLTKLFAQPRPSQQHVLFYCRSGQILKQVVHNLLQFFNLEYPTQLPSFIYFFPWEQSAQQALSELNLIDRTTS